DLAMAAAPAVAELLESRPSGCAAIVSARIIGIERSRVRKSIGSRLRGDVGKKGFYKPVTEASKEGVRWKLRLPRPKPRGLSLRRFVLAALPPAVRKGSAFPEGSLNDLYSELRLGFARVTLNVSMAPSHTRKIALIYL